MFTVYGKSGCIYCIRAKNLLDQKNLPYVYYDINEDEESQEFVMGLGVKTLPQIFDDLSERHHIGGYDDLVKYLEVI